MKTEVTLKIDDSQVSAKISGKITAGAVGIPVHIIIEGERWKGLAPKFVASCNKVARENAIVDGETTLPHECLISGKELYIGVDGRSEDGKVRIPTVWAYCGKVNPSVGDVNTYCTTPPTPELTDQILWVANNAEVIANGVKQRADDHEFDGFSPAVEIISIEGGHLIKVTNRDGEAEFEVMDGLTPEIDLTNYVKGSDLADVAKSGDYNDLVNRPTIPSVPTNVSAFTNDAGYLSQHQDLSQYAKKSDVPYVPAWALRATKPAYTAMEVGTYPIIILSRADYDSIAIKQNNVVYMIKED